MNVLTDRVTCWVHIVRTRTPEVDQSIGIFKVPHTSGAEMQH